MKLTQLLIAAVVLAAGSLAYAQDKPAAKPADPLDAALGKPALDPTTATKHDDNELLNDLANGKKEQPVQQDPDKIMQDFIDHTKAAGSLQKDKQDPGMETQDHQRRATVAMDSLIDIVKEMQKEKDQKQDPSQQPPKPGEKKEENPGDPQQGPPQDGQHQDSGTEAARQSQLPPGSVGPFASNGEMIVKDANQWGNLPTRDRDQILNSLQDGALKSYQEKIRKYYEALAEIGRNK